MRLMLDRRVVSHFDLFLLTAVMLIAALGTMTVYSASYAHNGAGASAFAWRQITWAVIGLGAMVFAVTFDYRRLETWAYFLYGFCLLLLIAVPVIGSTVNGSKRWLSLGPLTLQPSELMKLAVIITLARYFSRTFRPNGLKLRDLAIPLALALVPTILILVQPDLGSAALLIGIAACVILMAGPSPRTLGIIALAGVSLIPVMPHFYHGLKPYQQKRILTFFNPELDPLGAGYHVIQSKIAIGSGGASGKGFLHGTQNQLNFLPEQHTDFIFSVYSEEWGFIGASVLLLLYLALLLRGLLVVTRAKDRFGALIATGVLANVFLQVAINIGMTTGLLPVVGITLPLFSYGGSSLVTLMLGLGLVINVNMRRFTYERARL